MIPKESAYKIIEDLVLRFEEQIISYKKSDYNETQTRRDFIDPFLKRSAGIWITAKSIQKPTMK
jgi:hypothetical protein